MIARKCRPSTIIVSLVRGTCYMVNRIRTSELSLKVFATNEPIDICRCTENLIMMLNKKYKSIEILNNNYI